MKTCYFLIFTIFSFQFSLQGQNSIPYDRAQPIVNYENYDPIVDTSKLWSVSLQYANILYSMYYKIGDTISLDGYIYYEVLETNDSLLLSWTNTGYIREAESSEVYFRNVNGDEGLLYKFNLEANDSVIVYNPLVCPEYTTLIVSETDSIWLGDKYRKRIHFFNSNNEDFWTEGIGSRFGLLFSNYCYIGTLYNLICYYEFDSLIYQNPDFIYCYYPLIDKVSLINPSELFKIYYDKYNYAIEVHNTYTVSNSDKISITIFDILGNEVHSEKLRQNHQLILTNHFTTGLYLLTIELNGSLLFQSKIIIY